LNRSFTIYPPSELLYSTSKSLWALHCIWYNIFSPPSAKQMWMEQQQWSYRGAPIYPLWLLPKVFAASILCV